NGTPTSRRETLQAPQNARSSRAPPHKAQASRGSGGTVDNSSFKLGGGVVRHQARAPRNIAVTTRRKPQAIGTSSGRSIGINQKKRAPTAKMKAANRLNRIP